MTSIGFYTLLLVGLKASGYLLAPWWAVFSLIWIYAFLLIIAVVTAKLIGVKAKRRDQSTKASQAKRTQSR